MFKNSNVIRNYNSGKKSNNIIRNFIFLSVCSASFKMKAILLDRSLTNNILTKSQQSKASVKEHNTQEDYNIAIYLSQSQYPEEVIEGAKLIHSRINAPGPLKNHFDQYSLTGDKWDEVEGGRRFSTKNFNSKELKLLKLERFIQKTGQGKDQLSVNRYNWIDVLSGSTEKAWISNLSSLPAPKVYSVADIDAAYKAIVEGSMAISNQNDKTTSSTLPVFYLVSGVGVNGLHKTPLGDNSILQLASRFNFSESMTDVSSYITNHTHSPQACIEATIGSMHRQAHVINKPKIPYALEEIFAGLSFSINTFYRDGFMYLDNLNDSQKTELLKVLNEKIDLMFILPQWVINEFSMSEQLHVLSAAPNFIAEPAVGTVAYEIARLLIVKQYEIIGKLAAIRSKQTGETVPLHLTLLGMGVFHNNPVILKEAFRSVAKAIGSERVKVFIHGYSAKDIALVQNNVNSNLTNNNLFSLSNPINRDAFKALTLADV